jgi:hypothetical protein
LAAKHVFISYSTRDSAVMQRILRALEQRGVACWVAPRDIAPGANYGAAITEAIENACAMVLVFTANANRNAEEIKKEVVLAGQSNLVIVPARIENLMPSDKAFRYELSTRQWIDLFDNWDAGIDRLVAHVQHLQNPLPPIDAASAGLPPPAASPKAAPGAASPGLSRHARRVAVLVGGVAVGLAFAGLGFWTVGRLAPAAPNLAGLWQSAFGPVTFVQKGREITGSWRAAQGTGEIVSGDFDPATRKLEFNYRQTWNRAQGKAVLLLSPDDRTLSGTWTQNGDDGVRNGQWIMTRPN